jgi:hypothetical protein
MRFCGWMVGEGGHLGPCGAEAVATVRHGRGIPGHTPPPDVDVCEEHAQRAEEQGRTVIR